MGLSTKKNFISSQKITCEEAFQDLLKYYISFRESLEGSNKEKMGRKEKEGLL